MKKSGLECLLLNAETENAVRAKKDTLKVCQRSGAKIDKTKYKTAKETSNNGVTRAR